MRTYDAEITTKFIRITRGNETIIRWDAAEWQANPALTPTIANVIRFVLTATPEEVEKRVVAGLVVAYHMAHPTHEMLTHGEVLADGYELRMYPASKFYGRSIFGFLLYRVAVNGTGEALVDRKPRGRKELKAWCHATFGKEPLG